LQERDRSPLVTAAYTKEVAAFFAWLRAKTGKAPTPIGVSISDVQKYREHLLAAGRKPREDQPAAGRPARFLCLNGDR
jgi:hypothetical protein